MPSTLSVAPSPPITTTVGNDRSTVPDGQRHPTAASPRVTDRAFAVDIQRVGRSFARRHAPRGSKCHDVLRDLTLHVTPGEVVAILGSSGCGKSTLLRIAGGLDRPTRGAVRIDGSPVEGIDARCAFVFQEARLLPWRTVADNVALGLPSITRAAGEQRVAELLELVGLAAFAGHRPREISGGMAQRTALARALARNPGVLLLDEPFGALDALTRLRMQDLLLDVHAVAPTTVLLVTHDVDEALQLADRVVLLGTERGVPGATARKVMSVPGERPRDRGSGALTAARAELLAGLGIERHRH